MSEDITIALIKTSGTLIVGVFGAIVGFLLKDSLDRKREVESQRIGDRREHYRNLLLCLKSLSEGKREQVELLKFEYHFLWLYAPDPVIHSTNKLLQNLNSQSNETNVHQEVGELLIEMRKDLGFQRSKLSIIDLKTTE